MRTRQADSTTFVTKDGSLIRELMHPERHGNRAQSLAQATVPRGMRTHPHRHAISEELYHIQSGCGLMFLGDQSFAVAPGDTVLISPGTTHCIEAGADEDLVFLCCCAPAYRHDDTELALDWCNG